MPRKTKAASSNLVDCLNDQLSELVESARKQVETVSEALVEHVRERPFAALAAAFSAGFIFHQIIHWKRR